MSLCFVTLNLEIVGHLYVIGCEYDGITSTRLVVPRVPKTLPLSWAALLQEQVLDLGEPLLQALDSGLECLPPSMLDASPTLFQTNLGP